MHLIFGGAYQGKLEYAKERYGLRDQDVFTYTLESPAAEHSSNVTTADPVIDFSKKVIYKLEEFILDCLYHKLEAKDYLEDHKKEWNDKVLICTDISAGLVPYEEEFRAWREMVGRTMVYLGKEAEEVTRIFCGIPQKLK